MTKGITNESRRKELRNGFELHRIPKEISKDMSPEDQDKMHITPSEEERQFAKKYLIKEAQRQTYPDEYRRLNKGESISEKSPLIKFNLTLREGLMVMQSRLSSLHTMPEQMRNPIILPKDARITHLIILQHHKSGGSAGKACTGPALTLREVRLQYWVHGGTDQIRN